MTTTDTDDREKLFETEFKVKNSYSFQEIYDQLPTDIQEAIDLMTTDELNAFLKDNKESINKDLKVFIFDYCVDWDLFRFLDRLIIELFDLKE